MRCGKAFGEKSETNFATQSAAAKVNEGQELHEVMSPSCRDLAMSANSVGPVAESERRA